MSSTISWNTNRLRILVITTVVLLLGAVIYFLSLFEIDKLYWITAGWILLIILFLWLGNSLISKQLNRILPWLKYGSLRFIAQLTLGLVYSLLVVNLSYFLFKNIFTADPPTMHQLMVMNLYGAIIIVPVTSLYFGFLFLKSWRRSEVESEKFQKESMKSQLEALKNHLDPHFLFNNLNVLSSLIEISKEQSREFLDRFAEVYRFMLQHETAELIPLKRELEFADSYLYLLNVRFEELIQVKQNISENALELTLPPLTVQMLIENVVKHNFATEKNPLIIHIESDENWLTVRNNIQRKKENYNSGKSGLKNIENRYAYFTDRTIQRKEDEDEFRVTVPLLTTNEVTA